VLIASVLLTFALTRLVESPELTLRLTLPGFYFELPVGLGTLLSLMAAGVAASGMDWLLSGHPGLKGRSALEHGLLPALVTLVMAAPLALLPAGPSWWIGFGICGLLLAGVVLAEHAAVDPSSPRFALARSGLTALAYALFLMLVIALRLSGLRMILLIPPIFITAMVISLRVMHLDGYDRWDFPWALGIGLICAQLGGALRYWPLTPLQYGLVLLGPLCALTTMSANIGMHIPMRRAATGPGISLLLAWGLAVFLR